VPRDLFPTGAIAVAQLAGHEFPGFCQKRQDGLIALLPFILRVVALTCPHLLAVQGVHRRVRVDRDRSQDDIRGGPYGFSHPPLNQLNLPGYAGVQRIEETPECALRRQVRNLQYPGKERVPRYESQLVQPREADVDPQHYCENELVRGHYLGGSFHSHRFFNPLLEANLLEHRGHRKQAAIGRQVSSR